MQSTVPDSPPDTPFDTDELGQYRSVSTLAVAACVMGLLSPVVLVSPLLAVVPLLAAATALMALARIRSSSGGFTGIGLARWGLALAVFFGASAIARNMVIKQMYCSQADAIARDWITMASSARTDEALTLMTWRAQHGLIQVAPGAQTPMPFDPKKAAASLKDDGHVQNILKLSSREGPAINVSLVEFELLSTGREPTIGLAYELAGDSGNPLLVNVSLIRTVAEEESAEWLVQSWASIRSNADTPASP